MKRIAIQAGHWNTTTTATGAPNEMSFNVDIAFTVAAELRNRGFEVKVTDYNAYKDPEVISQDWDLMLSIHYDADIYGTGGGFVDYPEPSTDGATQESQRIAYLIRQEYFGTTLIAYHPERSNKNTRYYYLWKYLTAKTPCVIIECGVGMHIPDDWEMLHFNRPKVVEGIVKGICLAFNVPYPTPEPTPIPSEPSNSPENASSEPTVPSPEPIPSYPNEQPPDIIVHEEGETTPESENQVKLIKVKRIVWDRGWPWVKVCKIKELLPK